MLDLSKRIVIGLSAGAIAIFTGFVFKRWLNNSEHSPDIINAKAQTANVPEKAPANVPERTKSVRRTGVGAKVSGVGAKGVGVGVNGACAKGAGVKGAGVKGAGAKGAVDYCKLAPAISVKNSQLGLLLKYMIEKSAFKKEQESLRTSGCLTAVGEVAWSTNNPSIRTLCFKILTNISTNPDMLDEFVKPVVPLLYDTLTDEEEEEEAETLVPLLELLVNITSLKSHSGDIICDFHLKTIPELLSRYTPQINYHYDIVLASLKILVNMTCAEMSFDLSLVYMSMIHLLHGCKNNAVILRVLTLLRNILKSDYLEHDCTFDDELIRGIGTVLSSNEDSECLDIANQIYRIITEH